MKIAFYLASEKDQERAGLWLLAGHQVVLLRGLHQCWSALWSKGQPRPQVLAASSRSLTARLLLLLLSKARRIPLVALALDEEPSLGWSGRMFYRRCRLVLVRNDAQVRALEAAGVSRRKLFALNVDLLDAELRRRTEERVVLSKLREMT